MTPSAFREAIENFSTYHMDSEFDLLEYPCNDFGDLADLGSPEESFGVISQAVQIASENSEALVILGGDNAVTRPCALGICSDRSKLGIITLDAHLDLRHTENGLHNGNPIRQLISDGVLGTNISQLGIASFANSKLYADFARENGLRTVSMDELQRDPVAIFKAELDALAEKVEVVYFDLDVDVLDRAFAPACPGARPGGLTPNQVRQIAFMAGKHPKVKAMDLVEVDPLRDTNRITLFAMASFMLEFSAGVATR
jgi:arginase family enzyme